jgi:hypothetical protein
MTGYRLRIDTNRRELRISRIERGKEVAILASTGVLENLQPGVERNVVRFSCEASTLTARVNGAEVLKVDDDWRSEGISWLGLGTSSPDAIAEARFSSLVFDRR